jgi:hypothetical protein
MLSSLVFGIVGALLFKKYRLNPILGFLAGALANLLFFLIWKLIQERQRHKAFHKSV